VAILQNVGYENINGSHFKSRDIWFGGGGFDDPVTGGWIGRYLELEYAKNQGYSWPTDFPHDGMPDPLGLEFANEVSLGFHTDDTVPAGLSIPNPATFLNLVQELPGYNEELMSDPRGFPADSIRDTLYGRELEWILNIEKDTDKYAERLQQAYLSGGNGSVTYPSTYPFSAPGNSRNNPLSAYLQIIARLLAGGCQTRVFLVRIGGFDTHVNQVTPYDNTMGKHAALLHHVASAMRAFQNDLRSRGLEDRVLTVTFSEFGRRALANNSYGSDHGTVAPMMVFGNRINPGVIGSNPDLNRVSENNGNLPDGADDVIDYRTVFNTILQEWFEVDPAQIPLILPSLNDGSTPTVADTQPIFSRTVTAIDDFVAQRYVFNACYPNPVKDDTVFSFKINNSLPVQLSLYNLQGQKLMNIVDSPLPPGEHQYRTFLGHLPTGTYLYRIAAGPLQETKKLIKL
jgi:uncharacterized protein (DUF1501 family)